MKNKLNWMTFVKTFLFLVGIILILLQLLGLNKQLIHWFVILFGTVVVIESLENWKKYNSAAIFGICVRVFVFLISVTLWLNVI